MENNKKKVGGGGGGGSSPVNFNHLFGPKDSSPSFSFFGSIFPPSSTVGGRDSRKQDVGICKKHGAAPGTNKGESNYGGISNPKSCTGTNRYPNETVEPSYYSSSIYYGGQENYSPRTWTSRTTECHHIFKKDTEGDDQNGNNSNRASRGNWWQGSLYY